MNKTNKKLWAITFEAFDPTFSKPGYLNMSRLSLNLQNSLNFFS